MMKKLLIASALIAGSMMLADAENRVYTWDTEEIMGEVAAVSDNGKYAVIVDSDNELSYLWSIDDPEVYTQLMGGYKDKCIAGDVTDDGMVVAALKTSTGSVPAYYKDGAWTELEMHPGAVSLDNQAVAVSPDGKYIGGHQCLKVEGAEFGNRVPVLWTLNDKGEYDMTAYADLEFPDYEAQGFFAYAMSDDGRVFAGTLSVGFASFIPAIVKDGVLEYFYDITTVQEPWYYKDEIMGYMDIYVYDGYYERDTDESFSGAFTMIDHDGNCYGMRQVVTATGENQSKANYACIYNYNTDEWTYDEDYSNYRCGRAAKVIVPNGNSVIIDGTAQTYESAFGISFGGLSFGGIAAISNDGSLMGGCHTRFSEVTMSDMPFPLIIVLDEPLVSSVCEIEAVEGNVAIMTSEGRIDVAGAEDVAVYDLNGRLISTSETSHVSAGVYVVKADNLSRKVVVK